MVANTFAAAAFAVLSVALAVSGQVLQQSAASPQQLYLPQAATVQYSVYNNFEPRVYSGVYPYTQFMQGYGGPVTNNVVTERIDEPVQVLPTTVENREAPVQDIVYQFPDSNVNNEVDNAKQINSYTVQRHVVNQYNRVLRRYLKALNVNTVYNTNIQRVNHQKLLQVLNVVTQETHQPKLRIQYSRTDTVNDLGERSAPLVVETKQQFQRLPPVILPAQVEKVGYDGQPLSAVAVNTAAMLPVYLPAAAVTTAKLL